MGSAEEGVKQFLTLSFLSFLLENGKEKPTPKTRISYPYRTPKTPGKEGQTLKKTRTSSRGKRTRNSKKSKERKDREPDSAQSGQNRLEPGETQVKIPWGHVFSKVQGVPDRADKENSGQSVRAHLRPTSFVGSITWCDLFRPKFGQKTQEMISVHDVWEPLKQALLASPDVIISSQICVSKLQRFFTEGDGCWLPKSDCFPETLETLETLENPEILETL